MDDRVVNILEGLLRRKIAAKDKIRNLELAEANLDSKNVWQLHEQTFDENKMLRKLIQKMEVEMVNKGKHIEKMKRSICLMAVVAIGSCLVGDGTSLLVCS